MNLKLKLKFTYVCIGIFFFLGGVEYAVILPTCWLYLHERFNAEKWFFGMVLSAFQFTGLFAGPLMGRWSDKTKRTQHVILVANLFEIGGNIMYFMGIDKWFIFGSRLVCGIGTGAGAALVADLTRISGVTGRTSILSSFMAIRQFGLVIGPAFNLFLREMNFNIGSYVVDAYTSPGLFMAVLWTVHQLLVLFLFWELPKLIDNIKLQERFQAEVDYESSLIGDSSASSYREFEASRSHVRQSPHMLPEAAISRFRNTPTDELDARGLTSSTQKLIDAERFITGLAGSTDYSSSNVSDIPTAHHVGQPPSRATTDLSSSVTSRNSHHRPWKYYVDEFIRDEMVALLYQLFIGYFAQMSLETMITPISQEYLGFGELENSIFYSVAGVEILLVFLVIQPLSRRFPDRALIVFGNLLFIASLVYIIIVLPPLDPENHKKNIAYFIPGVAVDVAALPFIVVCTVSLFSKITREETQGFSQGIRRTVGGLGMILGPLWAGALIHELRIMFAVFIAGLALAVVLLLLSYRRLKPQEPDDVKSGTAQNGTSSTDNVAYNTRDTSTTNSVTNERTPLLS